jgi:hypothetical protein
MANWPIPGRSVEYRIPAETVTLQIPFAFRGTDTPVKFVPVSIPFDVASIDVHFTYKSSDSATDPSALVVGPFIPELGGTYGMPIVGITPALMSDKINVPLAVPRPFQGENLTIQLLSVPTTELAAATHGTWQFRALSGSAHDHYYGCVSLTFNRAVKGAPMITV